MTNAVNIPSQNREKLRRKNEIVIPGSDQRIQWAPKCLCEQCTSRFKEGQGVTALRLGGRHDQ